MGEHSQDTQNTAGGASLGEEDKNHAMNEAVSHTSEADKGSFAHALELISSRSAGNKKIDEDGCFKAHQTLYDGGGGGSAPNLGTASAMQALKTFTEAALKAPS